VPHPFARSLGEWVGSHEIPTYKFTRLETWEHSLTCPLRHHDGARPQAAHPPPNEIRISEKPHPNLAENFPLLPHHGGMWTCTQAGRQRNPRFNLSRRSPVRAPGEIPHPPHPSKRKIIEVKTAKAHISNNLEISPTYSSINFFLSFCPFFSFFPPLGLSIHSSSQPATHLSTTAYNHPRNWLLRPRRKRS
jgi:hypothetical protein